MSYQAKYHRLIEEQMGGDTPWSRHTRPTGGRTRRPLGWERDDYNVPITSSSRLLVLHIAVGELPCVSVLLPNRISTDLISDDILCQRVYVFGR